MLARYLDRARISPPLIHDSLIRKSYLNGGTEITPLRRSLANLFNLTEKITFRPNATQAFKDILEVIFYHDCRCTPNGQKKNPLLFITDIEHPVIIQMAKIILPKENVIFKFIADFFFNTPALNRFEVADAIVKEIIKNNCTAVVLSHVNWINGYSLDVNYICERLKNYNSQIVTIVDGAQALGNISIPIESSFENKHIDFYIGSGHKWLGNPFPIGFMGVAESFLRDRQNCVDFLFVSDYFSSFAGDLDYFEFLNLDTYNLYLPNLFNRIINEAFSFEKQEIYYREHMCNIQQIRELFLGLNILRVIEGPVNSSSGFFAVTGSAGVLKQVSNKMENEGFKHTFSNFSASEKKTSFIRISSPLVPFKDRDMNTLKKILLSF